MSGTAAPDPKDQLVSILNTLWGDPDLGESVRRKAKEKFPQITIPDDGPVATSVRRQLDAERAAREALRHAADVALYARERAREQWELENYAEGEKREMVEAYRRRLHENPELYGKPQLTAFSAASGSVAPAGSVDLALFLRNIHNWMAAGLAEKAFSDAFAALKPGGVLGVEEHRADPAGMPDVMASSGYVPQAYVVQLAKEAGFTLAAASEVNANPKDTRDYPFWVWTLPPVRRSSPPGQRDDPSFDHTTYDIIGESDRMTLKFVKSGLPHA